MSGVNDLDKNKWSYEKLFSYFEGIATDSKHLKDFTRMDIMNLNREKHSGLSTPFLGLEDPRFMPKNNHGDNVQWVWQSAFVVCKEVRREDEAGERAAMSECGMIIQKVFARLLHDRRRNAIIDFKFDETGGVPIKQVFRNCVGYRVTFYLPAQFDMLMRTADWNDIPEDEGVPPFATVYDQGTPIPLGAGDVHECSVVVCGPATVTNQTEDYSLSIPSGSNEKLPFGKVKNKEGNDVQVDYKPAADGYIYQALPNELRQDYVAHPTLADHYITYIGVAANGSNDIDSVWIITAITHYPNGTTSDPSPTAEDVAWTDRLTATYT
jgi:hypothetical protein